MEKTNIPYLDTPEKILIRMYEGLKSNYTKQGAIEFYNYYSKLPLSTILRFCDKIVSEPYKGFDFIMNIVNETKNIPLYCIEDVARKLTDKLSTAVSDENMSKAQSEEISKAMLHIQTQLTGINIGCIHKIAESLLEGDECAQYQEWAKAMYDKLFTGSLTSVVVPDNVNVVAYFPEILRLSVATKNVSAIYNILFSGELRSMSAPNEREDVIYSKTIFSKLLNAMTHCTMFATLIERLPDKMRFKVKELAETDTEVVFDKYLTVHESVNDLVYASPSDFVDSILTSYECESVVTEESLDTQIRNLTYEKAVLDATRFFESLEYINSYEDLADESLAYESVSSKLKFDEITAIAERCDLIDKDLVMLEYEKNGDATPVINKSAGIEPSAPEKGSLARRIQNNALDKDIQTKKKAAETHQKFQDVKNAAKAVKKVPENFTDAVNKQVKEWDDMDDERRKEYIIKPGNRKKYWKTLKLAIAHGLAFKINPIINIILAAGSWLSAKKNIRIRNELVLELDTEIKVMEQKIEDAKSKGDTQACYKLMRMKDKLTQERARVSTNSKIV